jgi:hypothetical protein
MDSDRMPGSTSNSSRFWHTVDLAQLTASDVIVAIQA